MAQESDQQLLDRFVAAQDQDALGEIVRRYLGLVHSAATRQMRDPHLASDITQAVFIVLVRKASSLRRDTVLPAWLFSVTRHAVANARRIKNRRQANLTRISEMTRQEFAPPADVNVELADEIRSVLDDGVAQLPEVERASLLMHFFGGKTHKEVGDALGLTEEAARKRVSRGLDKLRAILGERQATTLSAGAITGGAIASVLAAERAAAVQFAAPALVSSTANIATLANSTTLAASGESHAAVIIARGVSRGLLQSKIRTALVTVGIVLLAIAVTTLIAYVKSRPISQVQRINSPGAVVPTISPLSVTFASGTTVQFLGVSPYPPTENSWRSAGGARIDCPDARLLDISLPTAVPVNFEAAVRVYKPAGDFLRLSVPTSPAGASSAIFDRDSLIITCVFTQAESTNPTNLKLEMADSKWTTLATNEHPKQMTTIGAIKFESVIDDGSGQAIVTMRHPPIDGTSQIVAMDDAGGQYAAVHIAVTSLAEIATTCTFDIPPSQISKLLFQTRRVMQIVDVNDVSLSPEVTTHPTIIVRPTSSQHR